MPRTAVRTHGFTESVIREMTRVAREAGAINLAQGFPDFAAPALLKDAACEAIQADENQYAITWGTADLRAALERKYRDWYGMEVEGDRQITVTCGATEAMASIVLAIANPGDEIIVMEPFYENYGPDAILAAATPRFLTLEPPDYRLDPDRLAALVTPRTRAVILNTPNNPTGRVFDAEECEGVARVCREHDLLAITDEIYEHILYEGRHVPLATLDGMADRTIVVSGASKTFSVTGWRIGTVISPPPQGSGPWRGAWSGWARGTTGTSPPDTPSGATSCTTRSSNPASGVPGRRGRTTSWRTSRTSRTRTTTRSRVASQRRAG